MKHIESDEDVREVLEELREYARDGVGTVYSAEEFHDAEHALDEFERQLGL